MDKTKKIKNNKIFADRELRNMFAEFCIAKDLEHPNIAKYKYFMRKFDQNTKSWDFHIILELVDGPDMNSYIKESKPDIEVVRSIGMQISQALNYLHGQKIIHQDIKPENILMTKDL